MRIVTEPTKARSTLLTPSSEYSRLSFYKEGYLLLSLVLGRAVDVLNMFRSCLFQLILHFRVKTSVERHHPEFIGSMSRVFKWLLTTCEFLLVCSFGL